MKNNEKNLIFISNPFGYGPTSTTLAVMLEVFKLWKGRIIFIANKNNKNIINDSRIKIKILNDRDENILEKYIKSIHNPYIFSCMNRFIINPAKKNNIPLIFLDTLSWFWEEIPNNYLQADYYFYQNVPFLKKKKSYNQYKNAIGFSPIIGSVPKTDNNPSNKILVSVGGGHNPLTKSISKHYLDLLSILLTSVENDNRFLVIGGEEAIRYLKGKINHTNISLNSLDWNSSIKQLFNSKCILTTAGFKTTFEAFCLDKKIAFLLPMNKSQWKLENEIKLIYSNIPGMNWEDYFSINNEFNKLSEKDVILHIEKMAKDLLTSNKINKAINDFNELIYNSSKILNNNLPNSDGAAEIAREIIKLWELENY